MEVAIVSSEFCRRTVERVITGKRERPITGRREVNKACPAEKNNHEGARTMRCTLHNNAIENVYFW